MCACCRAKGPRSGGCGGGNCTERKGVDRSCGGKFGPMKRGEKEREITEQKMRVKRERKKSNQLLSR